MIRNYIYKFSPLFSGLLPFDIFTEDVVSHDMPTAKAMLSEPIIETGKERLFRMFSVDEFGDLSPELNSSLQVGFLGMMIGGVYGGFIRSRVAYMNFMENNQATTFKNSFDAKRKLQDQVTIAFGKGAYQFGWRLGLFSTSYVLITTSISVYRGKSSIIEYLVGGGVTGALYKLSMGPRAILVGGGLGILLGAVAGGLSLGILKLTGTSMEEVRYWQYKFHEERQGKFKEIMKEYNEKDDMGIFRDYKQNRRDVQHNLDNIVDEKKTNVK